MAAGPAGGEDFDHNVVSFLLKNFKKDNRDIEARSPRSRRALILKIGRRTESHGSLCTRLCECACVAGEGGAGVRASAAAVARCGGTGQVHPVGGDDRRHRGAYREKFPLARCEAVRTPGIECCTLPAFHMECCTYGMLHPALHSIWNAAHSTALAVMACGAMTCEGGREAVMPCEAFSLLRRHERRGAGGGL